MELEFSRNPIKIQNRIRAIRKEIANKQGELSKQYEGRGIVRSELDKNIEIQNRALREELEILENQKHFVWQFWMTITNISIAFTATLSLYSTIAVSFITIKHSKENLELNYLPSIDVQYDAVNQQIQVYNRGRTNLFIWGSNFNGEKQLMDDNGRLITPSGLPYHFPGKDLNQILASLLASKESVFVPFELFFKDGRGIKYTSKNNFFISEKNEQMGIEVQTTEINSRSW